MLIHRVVAKGKGKLQKEVTAGSKTSSSQTPSTTASRAASPIPSPMKPKKQKQHGFTSIVSQHELNQQQMDLAGLNLRDDSDHHSDEEPPKILFTRDKVLEAARAVIDADKDGRKTVSLVIIGKLTSLGVISYL